jgi:hypothetical protein
VQSVIFIYSRPLLFSINHLLLSKLCWKKTFVFKMDGGYSHFGLKCFCDEKTLVQISFRLDVLYTYSLSHLTSLDTVHITFPKASNLLSTVCNKNAIYLFALILQHILLFQFPFPKLLNFVIAKDV